MKISNSNGINFELDQYCLSGKVINSPDANGNILIPRSINYQSKEYRIVSLNEGSFSNNHKIKSIKFEKDSVLTSIDKKAFYNSSIEIIDIPSSVTEISEAAFQYYYNLRLIKIPENSKLLTIDKEAFSRCSLESLFIPPKANKLNLKCFTLSPNLNKITISPSNQNFSSDNNNAIIFTKTKQSSPDFNTIIYANPNHDTITIPSNIKIIGPFSFAGSQQLRTIAFSDDSQLTSIEKGAFSDSFIEKIIIPSRVTRIDESAFIRCYQLKSIKFSQNSKLNSIGSFAFRHCTDLKNISFPESINEIGEGAFFGCRALQSVEFGKNSNKITIGKTAFFGTIFETKTKSSETKVEEIEDEYYEEEEEEEDEEEEEEEEEEEKNQFKRKHSNKLKK